MALAALVLGPTLLTVGCWGSLDPNQSFPAQRPDGPTGSGGMGGGGTGGTGTPACDAPTMVIAPKCGLNTACHAAMGVFGDFVTNPDSILSKNALFGNASCMGKPLINPNLPPDGVFIQRLDSEVCGPGTRMPMAPNSPLNTDEINCIKSWVTGKRMATLDESAAGMNEASR